MSLGVGARLGHYAVTAKLGEGGMGEVWRATDTQLNRDVALKILPEAFATDPDRLARFQREAHHGFRYSGLGEVGKQRGLYLLGGMLYN